MFSTQAREQATRLEDQAVERLKSAFNSLAELIACCPQSDLDLPSALVTLKTRIDGLSVAYRVDRGNRRLELVDLLRESAA